jgi:hypothetical protein
MPSPNPIAAFNKWSCTLACISWAMEKHGRPISQEDIIYRHGLWFPEWFHRPGLMERGDIFNLLLRLDLPVRKFIHLNDKDESLKIISKYYSAADYIAGFALTRKPDNHCLAIDVWNGATVKLMNPDQTKPVFVDMNWDDLFQNHDSDILWIFR